MTITLKLIGHQYNFPLFPVTEQKSQIYLTSVEKETNISKSAHVYEEKNALENTTYNSPDILGLLIFKGSLNNLKNGPPLCATLDKVGIHVCALSVGSLNG